MFFWVQKNNFFLCSKRKKKMIAKQVEMLLFPEGRVLEARCKLGLSQLSSWATFLSLPVYFKPHR